MTSVSSPIDAKTISHILQRVNSTKDATRACLDVVPDPADTPLLHVAYLHAAETLIPSLAVRVPGSEAEVAELADAPA